MRTSHEGKVPTGGTVGTGAADSAARTAITPDFTTSRGRVQVFGPSPRDLSSLIDCAVVLSEAEVTSTLVRTCGKVALRLLQVHIPDDGARS